MGSRNPNTAALADFIVRTRPEQLDPDVLASTRRAVLDAIGCALGGLDTPLVEAVARSFRLQEARGPVPVIGGSLTLPAPDAALWNAIAINALDYDDTYEDGTNPIGHPGSSTVGALMALVGSRPDADLGEVITAAAVGYESAIRVALAVQPTQERRDVVWGLGPHQVFGAAAVAARLLRLDDDQTIACLGLAGVHTSLPSVWTAAGWLKDAVGWPTMTGVHSAFLAAAGFDAPVRILDGRRSYFATVASDRFQPDLLVDGLGSAWHVTGLSFKPYPACRWIHTTLDALSAIRARERFTPDEVERVDVAGFWELERLFLRYEPRDLIDAQFSLPYTCAQVLHGTPVGAGWFAADRLHDPAILATASRVHVATDPEAEAERRDNPASLRSSVTLTLRDGRRFSDRRAVAHGHPSDPLDERELVDKFLRLATPLIGERDAVAFADALLSGPLEVPAAALLEPVTRARAEAVTAR